jgi:hypothetical protein
MHMRKPGSFVAAVSAAAIAFSAALSDARAAKA